MGKKDLEIWEEKKRASAKEDGLKSAGPPRRFPCNVCKNLADFLLSVYLAGHITLRKIFVHGDGGGHCVSCACFTLFVKLL